MGLAEEDSVFEELQPVDGQLPDPLSGDHLKLAEAFEASQEPMHPWARTMYREGLSFNGNERSHLWLGGPGGSLVDLSRTAGADSSLDGRAAIAADLDADGDLDLLVHNVQRTRHEVFRNEVRGQALELRLRATDSQWEAIGAEVIVDGPAGPVAQVLARGAGFASCAPPALVFGLGGGDPARVTVRWPSGRVQDLGPLGPGRFEVVEGVEVPSPLARRGTPLPDPWPPGLKLGVGARVPELILADAEGSPVRVDPSLAAEGGRLVLAFWASYCAPCRGELAHLAELDAREGTRVLAISVDVPADRSAAAALAAELAPGLTPLFLSMEGAENEGRLDELIDLLRLPVPTAVEVGPDGRILAVLQGEAGPR